MPWTECHRMDEKPRFVSRFLDRASLEFGGSSTIHCASSTKLMSAIKKYDCDAALIL